MKKNARLFAVLTIIGGVGATIASLAAPLKWY